MTSTSSCPLKSGWTKSRSCMKRRCERVFCRAQFETYQRKEEVVGAEMMRHFEERAMMLQTLDSLWKEHLAAMDYPRQGIHLRGYA